MARKFKLQIKKTKVTTFRGGHNAKPTKPKQRWYPRIKAGNGEIILTGEMMVNKGQPERTLQSLVTAILDGNFVFEYDD